MIGPVGIAFVTGTTIWQFSKGNKKLKNEVAGQLIFISVISSGGSFVAKNEDLPSHESNLKLLQEITIRDEEYKKLIEDNSILQDNISYLKRQYNRLNNDIDTYKNIINQEKIKREESQSKILKLKLEKTQISEYLNKLDIDISILENDNSKKTDIESIIQLQELKIQNGEFKQKEIRLNEDIKYQDSIIKNASYEIKEKNILIEETENKNRKLQKENEQLKAQINDKDKKIEKTETTRKKEIVERWSVYYKDFEIKPIAVRDVSKFSKKEIWEIERALNELYSLKDYKSVSRGKIKGIC